MTWNEIYENAIDCACGEDALKVKDTARYEVKELCLEKEGYDLDKCEIPKEEVEYLCDLHCIKFYDNGTISNYIWE